MLIENWHLTSFFASKNSKFTYVVVSKEAKTEIFEKDTYIVNKKLVKLHVQLLRKFTKSSTNQWCKNQAQCWFLRKLCESFIKCVSNHLTFEINSVLKKNYN